MGLIIPILWMKTLRCGEVLVQTVWLMGELGFVLLTARLACLSRGELFLKAADCT